MPKLVPQPITFETNVAALKTEWGSRLDSIQAQQTEVEQRCKLSYQKSVQRNEAVVSSHDGEPLDVVQRVIRYLDGHTKACLMHRAKANVKKVEVMTADDMMHNNSIRYPEARHESRYH